MYVLLLTVHHYFTSRAHALCILCDRYNFERTNKTIITTSQDVIIVSATSQLITTAGERTFEKQVPISQLLEYGTNYTRPTPNN